MAKFSFRPALWMAAPLAALVLVAATAPAHAHAETCGAARLASVVDGNVFQGYGEVNTTYSEGQPLASRGVVYLTGARAMVTAPSDGIVEYAGPVENMGQVVIINIGRDYRVVLAGLSTLAVETGQTIRVHERIGAMPTAVGNPAHLYMELRCGEETVNPVQTIALR